MTTLRRLEALQGLEGAKRLVLGLATGASGVHAVLLYGAPGGGTTALAGVLAQAWLCTQPGPAGACGVCQSCRAFEREKNADLLDLRPEGKSRILKLGAIVSQNPADDDYPTPLKPFFRTGTLYARHKVAVLHDAERMNGAASNALLKTLEEPHPHAKLILTTTSVGTLLPTIRSRCLAVACALPSADLLRTSHPEATADDLDSRGGRSRSAGRDPPRSHVPTATSPTSPARSPPAAAARPWSSPSASGPSQSGWRGSRAATPATANAEALALMAVWVARDADADPRWTAILADAHRRILQNGNATIVMDASFARMLRA